MPPSLISICAWLYLCPAVYPPIRSVALYVSQVSERRIKPTMYIHIYIYIYIYRYTILQRKEVFWPIDIYLQIRGASGREAGAAVCPRERLSYGRS